MTIRGGAETLPGNLAGKLAVREPSKPRGSNLYHMLGWLRGWGQFFSSASFLPSQKAILCERHMVGVTGAAADLQQLWLLTFQGEVGKALSLCAEQHSTV